MDNFDTLHPSIDETLRRDVRLLGNLLGKTIRDQQGDALFQLVEEVRRIAKDARRQEAGGSPKLIAKMSRLEDQELLYLARAFTLFLHLANIAEQHHQVRQRRLSARRSSFRQGQPGPDSDWQSLAPGVLPCRGYLEETMRTLLGAGTAPQTLYEHVCKLRIDLILTAHPTEVVRRSIASKYLRIAGLLAERDGQDLSLGEQQQIIQALHRTITEVWETDEIRRVRPTPVDEAKTGMVVVEQTLWDMVPQIARQLDQALQVSTGLRLPLEAVPVRFGSWMGGDRDGNPNTTPEVTRQVCRLSRLRAAELFWREIKELRHELSMTQCDAALRAEVGDGAVEPYRRLLEKVLRRLKSTIRYYSREVDGGLPPRLPPGDERIFFRTGQLREPLMRCYQSLVAVGDQVIADGRLTDILRRLDCFGLELLKLDIRQEAERHSEALDAITGHIGLGSYLDWSEPERQEFLLSELQSNRPLVAADFPTPGQADPRVGEVLETFRTLARENHESFGAYIISMASRPSDVLAVELLQKECGLERPLRVVPLFERLEALQGAADCMRRLFEMPWYLARIQGRQEVMIGYSDSAKDAGKLAAAWGLYQAQEQLVQVFQEFGVSLTLFHGRGGTVARGGGPSYEAIRSQPPGSVNCSMRVTEQGEVIQAKYGLPGMAEETLQVYIGAVLEATLTPPPEPEDSWRREADKLAADALAEYQALIRDDPRFVPYFRLATPEGELGRLKIGSRPARRRASDDIQYLRAIPWIFAWTQTRLMLPAWLGVGQALESACRRGEQRLLMEMQEKWPFFAATLDSIEMVFSKTDPVVSALYDTRLVGQDFSDLGEAIRQKYFETVDLLLSITRHTTPLQNEPVVRQSISVRNTYVDPLNVLQVELLSRVRNGGTGIVEDALLIAINGIAAGMRNTG